MQNVFVVAGICLLAGAAARLMYPGRQSSHILGTMLIGLIGAVGGGMVSWSWWPSVQDQFQTGNLIVSILGAIAAIMLWAVFAYRRSLGGYRNR